SGFAPISPLASVDKVFLRSLAIRGFKSFADRTTLEFTQGISVIVGPNGSGKSNIADAIAWVLGEQGARALRGAQMADVIFAGSPSRPALGMAEVSMVIDNSAGLIPVPAAEIEISRTIYRSGESEYRLGGRPCRLLDIQELLSDTGMGRSLHTIVGQGALDEVLSARPEERRQFIEEAAGIANHRRSRGRGRPRGRGGRARPGHLGPLRGRGPAPHGHPGRVAGQGTPGHGHEPFGPAVRPGGGAGPHRARTGGGSGRAGIPGTGAR